MAHDRAWMEDALCVDVDIAVFYPKSQRRGVPLDYDDAKAMCEACPVKRTCLAFAIAHDIPYGVWGGWDWKQRQRLPKPMKQRVRRAWFRIHPVRRLSHSIGAYGTIRAPYGALRDASRAL